jgi:hypothetical protein
MLKTDDKKFSFNITKDDGDGASAAVGAAVARVAKAPMPGAGPLTCLIAPEVVVWWFPQIAPDQLGTPHSLRASKGSGCRGREGEGRGVQITSYSGIVRGIRSMLGDT